MADTIRTKAALVTLFADVGFPSQVSLQAIRDFLVTTMNGGTATAKTDGSTIAHGIGAAPTVVSVVGSVATEGVTVTSVDATNITIAIKKFTDGSAGTSQTVYWRAY